MTIHLCLVSAQATPNLTPLMDPATRPDEVILAVSADMAQRADWLEQVIRPRGIRLQRWRIDNPFDIQATREQILNQLSEHPRHDRFILNATGGTKPMSIAAYEIFRDFALPIFYVHPELDRLIWLQPKEQPPIDLADRLKLEDFLAAHGAGLQGRAQRQGLNPQQRDICHYLIEEIDRFSRPLRSLNWLANSAENGLRSKPLTELGQLDADLELLIDRFAANGFVQLKDQRLVFASEDDRFFVNGGWLELYVFDLCAQLRQQGPMQDLARNIQVRRHQRGQPVRNEIDVAALVENRLFLLECKAKKWQGQGPGADALYRLDSLKDLLGGLNARAMLVSYQPLPDHDRQRGADLRIDLAAGRDLQRLKEKLKSWFWP
jgi:hypothetical protein